MPNSLRVDYNAPFTLTFTFACVGAFMIAALTQGAALDYLFSAHHHPSWSDPLTYLRLFTHVLGHAGPEHLVGNLFLILLLGPMLEEKYGWQTLLLATLATALLTGLVMALFIPGILLGASGVVFALIVLSSFSRMKSGTIPLTFLLVAVLFLGQEIVAAITANDNIAQFAHILGGAVGGTIGWLQKRG